MFLLHVQSTATVLISIHDTCATVAVFETTHVMLVEVNDSVTDEV